MPAVRGRFAPSPSGRMHLGNVFCALLAWLSARAQGGEMILRIEDLDPDRCRDEYTALLEDDLRWLGLTWDVGGTAGGSGYLQSRCTEYYASAFQMLSNKGLTYPCFCTRAELHAASAPHRSDGLLVYPGTCRALSEELTAEKAKLRRPAMRLRVPDQTVSFTDGVCGAYAENLLQESGDFVIRRADGVYAYQLAVVGDDGRMGVTEIVRGQDLLSSTPRQLYLYALLGLPAPSFYHIPLLLAPDGRRLSKRDGDLDLGALRRVYASPEPLLGVLGWLAGLVPWPAPVTANELIATFDWGKVPRSDITLDAALYTAIAQGIQLG